MQEVGGIIPDSLEPGIFIRAREKTSDRESGDKANYLVCMIAILCLHQRQCGKTAPFQK